MFLSDYRCKKPVVTFFFLVRRMKKILFIFIFCFGMSFILWSQEKFVVGEKHKIHSSILNEEREYWIYLPDDYENLNLQETRYPVVYVLDGEFYFFSAVAAQKALAKDMYSYMPKMIVAGVVNTNRSRDLTPTKSAVMHAGKLIHKDSGEANRFHEFLTKELRTEIDSNYRTDGYNLLLGHSFGGLFALYAFINHTFDFQAYITHDPSLWWDDKVVFSQLKLNWKSKDFKGVNLYVSMAGYDNSKPDKLEHSVTIEKFCKEMVSQPANNLRVSWGYFENEDHGTIFLPATYAAFKFLYKNICLPVKEVPDNPELIEEHYKQVSEDLGHKVIPDQQILDNICNYSISTGNIEGARAIAEINLKYHPESPLAHLNMAKVSEKEENFERALQYYQLAVKFNPVLKEELNEKIESLKIKN